MSANSKIEWCHHTFNPWRGCTHVSPGCEHCYAETLSKRNPGQLGTWGAGGTRVVASESYWRQPERWNRAAEEAGERHRVFCASLADVFEDRAELVAPRIRLWKLIEETPALDWLILTKRPECIEGDVVDGAMVPNGWLRGWPPNVWLGVSVEDQRRADERIPLLLDTPAAVRFLSCEPLIGPVDLTRLDLLQGRAPKDDPYFPRDHHLNALTGHVAGPDDLLDTSIDWVIVGGESGGPRARPMDIVWAHRIVGDCRKAGVPVFVKQLGATPYVGPPLSSEPFPLRLRDRKGGDPDEWATDLRVREFPQPAAVDA